MAGIKIQGTRSDDMIKILGVQKDAQGHDQLTYQVNNAKKTVAINDGDSLVVDFSETQGQEKQGDVFLVGENVDLSRYRLVVTGGKKDDLIAAAQGAKLGDVVIDAGDGDDVVQFGEFVRAKSVDVKMGAGRDNFQLFNRYQDERFRHPAGEVDPRFTPEAIEAKAKGFGSQKNLEKEAGFQAESLSVAGEGGDDSILLGSGWQVKTPVQMSGGEGDDKHWIGSRSEGVKPVEIKDLSGYDVAKVDHLEDATFTNPIAQELIFQQDRDVSKDEIDERLKKWEAVNAGKPYPGVVIRRAQD